MRLENPKQNKRKSSCCVRVKELGKQEKLKYERIGQHQVKDVIDKLKG